MPGEPLSAAEDISVSSSAASSTTTSLMIRPDRKVIFINLVVLDASNAIDAQLSQKLRGVCKPIRLVAQKAVTTLATPERVAAVMAEKLPRKLVEKLASKGLTAAAQVVFVQGPYVVLQLQILSADPTAMIAAQSVDTYDKDTGELEQAASLSATWGTRLQGCLQTLLTWLGVKRQASLQDEILPQLVQSKMPSIMGEIMADKLESKGLQSMSAVLPESQQGRYFFDTLLELRRVKEEAFPPKYKIVAAVATAKQHVQKRAENLKRSLERIKPKPPPPLLKLPGKKVV